MSETQTEAAPAKRKPGRPPKVKAAPPAEEKPAAIEPVLEDSKPEEIPPGFCECYAAIPGVVSLGGNQKANPGDKLTITIKNAEELELKQLAYRSEEEAKNRFIGYKREREAEIKLAVEAERKRRENRERIRDDLYSGDDGLEWNG